jgi:hypothetical protein
MKLFIRCALAGMIWAGGPFIAPGTALADHDRGGYDYRDGECDYGGCGEREERYGDGSCKYCPSFKDSPIHICLPGSTCNYGPDRRQDEERPR